MPKRPEETTLGAHVDANQFLTRGLPEEGDGLPMQEDDSTEIEEETDVEDDSRTEAAAEEATEEDAPYEDDAEFYAGSYKTRESTEEALREKDRTISRLQRETAEERTASAEHQAVMDAFMSEPPSEAQVRQQATQAQNDITGAGWLDTDEGGLDVPLTRRDIGRIRQEVRRDVELDGKRQQTAQQRADTLWNYAVKQYPIVRDNPELAQTTWLSITHGNVPKDSKTALKVVADVAKQVDNMVSKINPSGGQRRAKNGRTGGLSTPAGNGARKRKPTASGPKKIPTLGDTIRASNQKHKDLFR